MTIATWPSDLPQLAMVDNFTVTEPDGRLRSTTDTGPGKVRLISSSMPTKVQMQIRCTFNDAARFDRFWKEDTQRGVLLFWIPDSTYDGLALTDENDNILTDQNDNILINTALLLAQFDDPPSRSAVSGGYFNISIPLMIMP